MHYETAKQTLNNKDLQFMRLIIMLLCILALIPNASAGVEFPPSVPLNSHWYLQDASRIKGAGTEISMLSFHSNASWYRAVVPGTVLTSLVADGVYPEPLYGRNSLPSVIPDSLCRTSYWYRTTFRCPSSFANRQIFIKFNGINYEARIWLNGHYLGIMQGAFIRGVFNITGDISHRYQNVVAVEILPPDQPGHPVPQTLGRGYGPNGGVLEGDTPTFFDTIGWDWIPGIADRDMGIWQGVSLFATGPVVIQHPYVTTKITFAKTNSANINVQTSLSNVTDHPQTGQLVGVINGRLFVIKHIDIPAKSKQTVTASGDDFAALKIVSPHLWWPNGYGPHTLYKLKLQFTQHNYLSDSHIVSFGIRSITYGIHHGTGTLKLTVNQIPIMIRGGDWGMDEALKRSPKSRLEAQIKLNAAAGFTMIRNWCGQTTQEEFYRLCDKYGILVWNDYWLDDTVHYGIARQKEMFLANARDMLLHYRNHPCIAVWCEKNEFPIGPPFEAGMRQITNQLDPSRWLQACSSSGNGVGDGHYGIEPVVNYFKRFPDAFHTEMGAPSIPTLQDVHAMMPEKDWNTFDDDWTEHDMCQYNYQEALTRRYGPITGTADFVRKAQLADYETYRAIFEGHNASMFAPYTGIMIWMSNPAQPSMVWQIYSYDLEPDSSYFAVKHACEPVHIQMSPGGLVQVINNTTSRLKSLKVEVSLYNLNGTQSGNQRTSLSAKPLAATDVLQIKWTANISPVSFVQLRLRSANSHIISENFYWHSTAQDGENYHSLQTMPLTAVKLSGETVVKGDDYLMHIQVSNPNHSVALLVHLQLRNSISMKRILPVYYSDNYFSLVPGASRQITLKVSRTAMNAVKPVIAVDGWNVTCHSEHFKEFSVVPDRSTGFAHVSKIRNIDCGVGWLPGYAADCYYKGGNQEADDEVIATDGVPHADAPILYRTDRHGPCSYSIPVTQGHVYKVLLHFAETYYTGPHEREFNVSINGEQVLHNFDVFASAGGKDRALVEEFRGIRADPKGRIDIQFSNGAVDQPTICGIQIVPQASR